MENTTTPLKIKEAIETLNSYGKTEGWKSSSTLPVAKSGHEEIRQRDFCEKAVMVNDWAGIKLF